MDNSKQKWQSKFRYKVYISIYNLKLDGINGNNPDLWFEDELLDFKKSERGKWLIENVGPVIHWHVMTCYSSWQYEIYADFTPEQLTFYKLKYE